MVTDYTNKSMPSGWGKKSTAFFLQEVVLFLVYSVIIRSGLTTAQIVRMDWHEVVKENSPYIMACQYVASGYVTV
jgi:hypothetical protein